MENNKQPLNLEEKLKIKLQAWRKDFPFKKVLEFYDEQIKPLKEEIEKQNEEVLRLALLCQNRNEQISKLIMLDSETEDKIKGLESSLSLAKKENEELHIDNQSLLNWNLTATETENTLQSELTSVKEQLQTAAEKNEVLTDAYKTSCDQFADVCLKHLELKEQNKELAEALTRIIDEDKLRKFSKEWASKFEGREKVSCESFHLAGQLIIAMQVSEALTNYQQTKT